MDIGNASWEEIEKILYKDEEENTNDENIKDIFTSFNNIFMLSNSLIEIFKNGLDSNCLISLYFYENEKLSNIFISNDIENLMNNILNSVKIGFYNINKNKYSIELREIHYYKNIEDIYNILKFIDQECFDKNPINFYQTFGENIYRIKYRSKTELRTYQKKSNSNFDCFQKLSDKKISKKFLKKKENIRENQSNSNIFYKEEPIISYEVAKNKIFLSNTIFNKILKNRERVCYVNKNEEEIGEWKKKKKRDLRIYYKSLNKEELRLK